MFKILQWLLLLFNLLLLTTGPLKLLLEEQMVFHLLIQLPVLVFMGWLAGELAPKALHKRMEPYNHHGITGVILITVLGLFWMLPSALDAALESNSYALAKVASMLLIGISWSFTRRCIHPLVKGVFLLELWAMLGRFGYLFKVSPDRLCTNYLLGEQQLVGHILLMLSITIGTLWVIHVLFGNNKDLLQGAEHLKVRPPQEIKGVFNVLK